MSEKAIRAWRLTMAFNGGDGSTRSILDVDFVATDAVDAATKVLAILQSRARRFRNRRGMFVVDCAAPHGFDRGQGKNFLVGDEMLRLRKGLNSLSKLLRVEDPLDAFTVGYGRTRRPLRESVSPVAA
jgi:hypothetical protein